MLMRCARMMAAPVGLMAAPMGMAAGLVFTTGLAVGAGAVGAGLLAKRMWEERQGWRATSADDPMPPMDPVPDAPDA